MSISEPEVWGKGHGQFAVTYTLTSSIAEIIGDSGLWREVPGADWETWAASVKDVYTGKGLRGLGFDVDDDLIVSLSDKNVRPQVP